ncbi:MAG: hypothetical protein JWN62_2759 [Acidimicrobiales bacterium]|nr:hypothetical protein [Acidimicrobiales bacterium]
MNSAFGNPINPRLRRALIGASIGAFIGSGIGIAFGGDAIAGTVPMAILGVLFADQILPKFL